MKSFSVEKVTVENTPTASGWIDTVTSNCLSVIIWNDNLMQQGNFINVFLAPHVSGTYAHHQEHQMLSCSIWFSAPSFWMGGGLESRCVGRVCGADGKRQHPRRKHDLRNGSQDHHPSKNSVQKTTRCYSKSDAPDDGRMYPKHVEQRIY